MAIAEDRRVSQSVPRDGCHLGIGDAQLLGLAHEFTEVSPLPAILCAVVVGASEVLDVPALAAPVPDDRFRESDLVEGRVSAASGVACPDGLSPTITIRLGR